MQIAYIHGFNSSSRSFAFVVDQLPKHSPIIINYDSHKALDESIAAITKQLPKTPTILVGHSLGGVIAAIIAAQRPESISKLAIISAPIGGSKAAATLRWIPGHPKILHDITPNSKHVRILSSMKLSMPTLSIISTGGNLVTLGEPNDSIVTVASQRALGFGKKVEVKANHFEVLMHEKTVKHLEEFLFAEKK